MQTLLITLMLEDLMMGEFVQKYPVKIEGENVLIEV